MKLKLTILILIIVISIGSIIIATDFFSNLKYVEIREKKTDEKI